MRQIETAAELMDARRNRDQGTTGFVPTMGALHEGHFSLIARARAENDRVWASVFVNPAQFDEPRDLEAYPRTLDEDLKALESTGVDLVFLPREDDMYPDGYRYRVNENEFSRRLEGVARPGHFDGVLTVVMKLLLLVRPERAYFGDKDWQQLRLVEGLARAFFLDTAIVPCPIVRESDGLAMSSRNRRLTPGDRAKAPTFYRTLERSIRERQSAGAAADRLRRAGFKVEYVEDHDGRRLAAVQLGAVRLIDNVPNQDGQQP